MVIFTSFIIFSFAESQHKSSILKYCAINNQELLKCQDWANAITIHNKLAMNNNDRFRFNLECITADNKDHCMKLIENQQADFVLAEPGEIYIAGRYHSLVPIVYEQYGNNSLYYSVAVVKTSSYSYITELKDLRNKKACFSGVGQLAGWILPISKLLQLDLIDTLDCNNIIQNTANFFGPSCAPNALIEKNNPIGTNPQSICSLCMSKKCAGNDLYSNFEGALLCLLNGGDVAFVKHTVVDQMVHSGRFRRQDFQLLCPNGDRTSLENFMHCNWGQVPPHSVLVSSAVLPADRKLIQDFLLKSAAVFSRLSFHNSQFKLFESNKYGSLNLIFSDDTVDLRSVDHLRSTFRGYFSIFDSNLNIEELFGQLRKCNVPNAKLCVVSQPELEKCNNMKSAFRTNMLQPQLTCVQGQNTIDCMKRIQEDRADLTMLDAADVHLAGQRFNLEPIMAEQNNINDSYYAVAITKKADPDTDLLYLKGKKSCHSGYRTAAGWVVPMSFLLSNSRMRSYGCNSIRAASEFFSKSCVPGALSPEYHGGKSVWQYNNLCNLCHGNSYRFCRRDSSETYFGDTGAFQCLVEGGGDVAFAKHTVIFENTNGINSEYWARNKFLEDFELLCPDGSRSEVQDFAKCNLGQVATNALVTNKYKPHFQKEAYITLLIYAQQFYGSKYSNEFTFKMFDSGPKYKNLIFQDSTVKLKPIPSDKRNYQTYLGHEFLTAMSIVDCVRNHSNLFHTYSHSYLICILLITFLLNKII